MNDPPDSSLLLIAFIILSDKGNYSNASCGLWVWSKDGRGGLSRFILSLQLYTRYINTEDITSWNKYNVWYNIFKPFLHGRDCTLRVMLAWGLQSYATFTIKQFKCMYIPMSYQPYKSFTHLDIMNQYTPKVLGTPGEIWRGGLKGTPHEMTNL